MVLYDAAIEFQRDPILKSHMSGLDLGQSVDGIPDSTRRRLDLHLSMESRATAWKGRGVEDLSTASAELVVKNLHRAKFLVFVSQGTSLPGLASRRVSGMKKQDLAAGVGTRATA